MFSRHPLKPIIAAFLSGGAALALAGCENVPMTTEPMSTIAPNSEFAWMIQDLYVLIFWLALVVFVIVEAVLLYSVVRYRRRPGQALPEQVHGNTRMEIAWTIAPALVLVLIAVPTVQTIFFTQTRPADFENALPVRAIGHQWWFEFQYPGLGITTANELHVQRGQTVYFDLESADIIHSFWFPRMGGKRDMVPGRINNLWFTPTTAGRYIGQCVEYCGTSHANMRMILYVHEPADWEAWIRDQLEPAQTPPDGTLAARGAQLFTQKGCIGCHAIQGNPVAVGRVGPDLSSYGDRSTLAAGIAENTPENLVAWLKNPPKFKPGALMPNLGLSDAEAEALAAYLLELD